MSLYTDADVHIHSAPHAVTRVLRRSSKCISTASTRRRRKQSTSSSRNSTQTHQRDRLTTPMKAHASSSYRQRMRQFRTRCLLGCLTLVILAHPLFQWLALLVQNASVGIYDPLWLLHREKWMRMHRWESSRWIQGIKVCVLGLLMIVQFFEQPAWCRRVDRQLLYERSYLQQPYPLPSSPPIAPSQDDMPQLWLSGHLSK